MRLYSRRKGVMDMLGRGFTLEGAQQVFGLTFMQPSGMLDHACLVPASYVEPSGCMVSCRRRFTYQLLSIHAH